jgi:hypothetical protein
LLRRSDIPVWFDKEIITGNRWQHLIREKIDSCSALIVVMTSAAEESNWVALEIARAQRMSKPIFPLLLQGDPLFVLGNLQYEDVTSGNMPRPQFIESLRAAIGQGPPSSNGQPPNQATEVLKQVSRAVRDLSDDELQALMLGRARLTFVEQQKDAHSPRTVEHSQPNDADIAHDRGEAIDSLLRRVAGFRQREILSLPGMWEDAGLSTGEISRLINYDQPNVYSTLQVLQGRQIVERADVGGPQRWRIHATYR